ncbi:hypothetical protein HYQ46_011235 [Verticillium longisporum]|nr:hypothetical protein HYQ46_011235 [Verticillium longisporum]
MGLSCRASCADFASGGGGDNLSRLICGFLAPRPVSSLHGSRSQYYRTSNWGRNRRRDGIECLMYLQ